MSAEIQNIGKPIVIVGSMGAGKTTIGRELANKIGVSFMDSDDKIIELAGKTIEEIFQKDGENVFRNFEYAAVKTCLSQGLGVVSTGGGAFVQENTHALIQEQGLSVYLRADVDTLIDRIQNDKCDGKAIRPLLEKSDPKSELRDLLSLRSASYEKADIIIDTDQLSVEEAVNAVIQGLHNHLKHA